MNKIVLGVTGSIAAYKSLSLVRLLIKAGKEVKVIMTPTACEFVSALSFSTLSKNDTHVDLVDAHTWNNHVELGLWADVMLIAPATATTLGKMANGIADNMLLATYLSAKCPVYIAPAMDLDMWKHPSTQRNISLLESYGNKMIPVGHGELASGLVGEGRMAEPEDIIEFLTEETSAHQDLNEQHVLITAGPTQESIDPVRFITNHSSGTMGIRIAEECARRGAKVSLVLGPTHLKAVHPAIDTYNVKSAADMYNQCAALYEQCDVAVYAAAVADYTPATTSTQKLKKADDDLSIPLARTIDIAKTLGEQKTSAQIAVGFALETEKGVAYAQGKLAKKNFDFIVLNSLSDEGAGFGTATNKITILKKDAAPQAFDLKSKTEVAKDIVDAIVDVLLTKNQ